MKRKVRKTVYLPEKEPHSTVAEFRGRAPPVVLGGLACGCFMAFWSEANVLTGCRYHPGSGEADYNTEVTLERLSV